MKTYFSIGSISIEQLVQMCDGTLLQYNNDMDSAMVKSICTDSREADKDSVFCAIKGERVDGHDFVNAAQAGGCRAFLCERVPQNVGFENCSFIVVPNVEKAILTLASGYCQGLSAKTVAVTGSVGKTTTKDMIAAVLNTKYNAFKTKGNFNSVIGMPLLKPKVISTVLSECRFPCWKLP